MNSSCPSPSVSSELSLSEQIYDVITLYHVLDTSRIRSAQGAAHGAKPGGHLIIEVPNIEGTCGEPAHRFHFAHLYNFNPATLGALARKAGYTVLETSISSDGGNVAVFLQKASELSGFDGRIPGNCAGRARRARSDDTAASVARGAA
jgi:hypothetical protein